MSDDAPHQIMPFPKARRFDHDIVDGAPAARFAQRFTEIVEAGEGLPEG